MDTINPKMTDYSEILSIYQDDELKSKIKELFDALTAIIDKEPVYGFGHKFYVPGFIGVIQQSIVEKKMDDFASKPYYQEQNYYEFANVFLKSNEVCEMLVRSKQTYATDDELYGKQCGTLIKIYDLLLNAWINTCPEVATYCNLKYDDNTLISIAGVCNEKLSESLKLIGYVEVEKKTKSGSSFKKEMQGVLYQMAGYILNCLLFAALFGLGSLIFG